MQRKFVQYPLDKSSSILGVQYSVDKATLFFFFAFGFSKTPKYDLSETLQNRYHVKGHLKSSRMVQVSAP